MDISKFNSLKNTFLLETWDCHTYNGYFLGTMSTKIQSANCLWVTLMWKFSTIQKIIACLYLEELQNRAGKYLITRQPLNKNNNQSIQNIFSKWIPSFDLLCKIIFISNNMFHIVSSSKVSAMKNQRRFRSTHEFDPKNEMFAKLLKNRSLNCL